MAKFKNIRIKMRGGKSRLQRVKVLASGKFKFVKNLRKHKASNPRVREPRKVKKVARRRRYTRRRRPSGKSIMRTAEKFIGVGAFLYPGLSRGKAVWDAEHDAIRAVKEGLGQYAGMYDDVFHLQVAVNAWAPYLTFNLLRGLAHKVNGIIRSL